MGGAHEPPSPMVIERANRARSRTRQRIAIEPSFSPKLAGYVVLVHLLAFLTVAVLPIPLPVGALLYVAIAFSLIYMYATHVLRMGPLALKAIALDPVSGWILYGARVTIKNARLRPESLVLRQLIILNFSIGWLRSRSIVLTPDAVNSQQLRRLRVAIRLGDHLTESPIDRR